MFFEKKKQTFYLLLVATITVTGFLLFYQRTARAVMTSETRAGHNFRMLAKTLKAKHKYSYDDQEARKKIKTLKYDKHDVPSLNIATSTPERAKSSSLVDRLTDIFHYKMSKVESKEVKLAPVCHTPDVIANSCDNDKCLQMNYPADLKDRIAQIVQPTKLQISPQVERVLESMARKVRGDVKFMILSATSSNHYHETQALLHNLHKNIFPHFKNFTLVLYDLGLSSEERNQMVRFCKCQVVDFPFQMFPNFVSQKLCYSWKPVIVRAHIEQADTVLWVDASIRFDADPVYFSNLLQRTKRRTMQIAWSRAISPFRTYRSMYHFFGDEPCMYLNMGQVQSGIDIFTNDFFVKRVVLDPWAACAVTQHCMCPLPDPTKSCADSKKMTEAWKNGQGPIVYGLCHRYDQSSLSVILHKLYQGYFRWVTFDVSRFIEIGRKDTYPYFDSLAQI